MASHRFDRAIKSVIANDRRIASIPLAEKISARLNETLGYAKIRYHAAPSGSIGGAIHRPLIAFSWGGA
jgi:hypothetical protein